MISKLGENILDRTNCKLNLEEEKVMMLKLFIVYYHADPEKHESSAKLIE